MDESFRIQKAIWEDGCNMAEDRESLYVPGVKAVSHQTPLQKIENTRVRDLFMKTTRKKVQNNSRSEEARK